MYYKLTDKKGQTFGNIQWGEGVTHTAQGRGNELCTNGVIHVYDDPYKAVLFNPIHAHFASPKLWECEVENIIADDGLKIGVKSCTTLREIPLPGGGGGDVGGSDGGGEGGGGGGET